MNIYQNRTLEEENVNISRVTITGGQVSDKLAEGKGMKIMRTHFKGKGRVYEGRGSVSYTHLDVYKRQKRS